MVLGGEKGGEKRHGGQIHRSVLEFLKHNGKPAGRSGGLNAPIGSVLREMQDLCAVCEQRGAAFSEIETPLIQLCEVRNEG